MGAADAEIKAHCVENPELPKVLPSKHRVGQTIALYASIPPGISFLLLSAFPLHSTSSVSNPLHVFLALGVTNAGSLGSPQNKIDHLLVVTSS